MWKILQANTLISEDQLVEMQKQGWILVTIVTGTNLRVQGEQFYFYFRRVE